MPRANLTSINDQAPGKAKMMSLAKMPSRSAVVRGLKQPTQDSPGSGRSFSGLSHLPRPQVIDAVGAVDNDVLHFLIFQHMQRHIVAGFTAGPQLFVEIGLPAY